MSERRRLRVTSADGTEIAVTATGQGRALVVAHGSLATARQWQPLADNLAPHLTTYAIDRRGRAASGDHPEHDLEREQQDIAAVMELAGPDAILLGHSYGGTIALGHALRQAPSELILYEPGLAMTGPVGGDAVISYERLVETGDLAVAFEYGLRHFLQMSEKDIDAFRADPTWPTRAELAPTWGRELRAIDTFDTDIARFTSLHSPTLLLFGGLSPSWLTNNLRRLHQALPNAHLAEIPGHAHDGYLTGTETVAQLILDFATICPRRRGERLT